MQILKIVITEEKEGQRLDNFLITLFKAVPKSRLYRAIRNGEVRVNQKRKHCHYKLSIHDEVKLPAFQQRERQQAYSQSTDLRALLEQSIIYEDAGFLLINKPSGLSVHGGTEVSAGLIETLRQMRPPHTTLELIHRLDKDTSGLLMIAKKRRILIEMQDKIRQQAIKKQYLALVKGVWSKGKIAVTLPLCKNRLQSGERVVQVDSQNGKFAKTWLEPVATFEATQCSLVLATLVTGRTHQIRVHAAALGYPVAGDSKYGDKAFNQAIKKQTGLSRLFLHSARLDLTGTSHPLDLCCLPSPDLQQVLTHLEKLKG